MSATLVDTPQVRQLVCAISKPDFQTMERWAKFWEPTQRCFYFVSDASGESRWAAHFDDDVMVVETEDDIRYVHHAIR